MSDLGYRNKSQAGLSVSVNSLDHYVRDLTARDQHAASRVREARREGGRRVPAAQRQPAADRERVLQLHPPEARHADAASGRPRRCSAAACSTSRCARST
ncbi:MAG: glutamate--cysteine ligase [Comamonadaceae bacterium]|nr:glutamate--cysteine ligase [Comamonadaceae bacterium]